MSERSKGDVSRVNNNATRVVKNPLLSASVTGLSFDDFPNKPQLLPAAPPVVHAPLPPTPVLVAGILNREPKTLVTVGQSSAIDETENLDEINLNASNDEELVADSNANPLLDQIPSNDSLLSQAASSFTALPAVASNVFSTFSKRIYSGSSSRERTPLSETDDSSLQPQLEIQPHYLQQANYNQQLTDGSAPAFYAPPPPASEALAPPKFYTPAELPALPTPSAVPPPSVGGQNTYRFTAKKKLYAPIPGLSEQKASVQVQQQPLPIQTPSYPQPHQLLGETTAVAFQDPKPAEERKPGGGLFSLTSLVPTGVLQNISGLVQSATGSFVQQPPKSNEINYIAPDPTAVSYLTPATAASTETTVPTFFTPSSVVTGNYFVPEAVPPPAPTTQTTTSAPPPSIGGFFAPTPASLFGEKEPATATAEPPAVAGLFPGNSVAPIPTIPTNIVSPIALPAAVEPPPTLSAAQPPPPAAGPSSYRLQKGTRLYKSPLTSQEVTPATFTPFQTFAPQSFPPAAPSTLFNPFEPPKPDLTASELRRTTPAPPVTTTSQQTEALTAAPLPSSASFAPQPFPTAAASTLFNPFEQAKSDITGSDSGTIVPAPFVVPNQQTEGIHAAQLLQPLPPAASSTVFNSFEPAKSDITGSESNTAGLAPPTPFETELNQQTLRPSISLSGPLPAPLFDPATSTSSADPEDNVSAFVSSAISQSDKEVSFISEAATIPGIAAPPSLPSTAFGGSVQEVPLFASPTTSLPSQPSGVLGVPLFYPPSTSASIAESKEEAPPFSPTAPALGLLETANSINEPLEGTDQVSSRAEVATNDEPAAALFNAAPPEKSTTSKVSLTTQTTTTFFNPFVKPSPLETSEVKPEYTGGFIGFVAPDAQLQSQQSSDTSPLKAQTIEPVIPEAVQPPPVGPPPRQSDSARSQANPFRRGSETIPPNLATAATVQPSALLNFFTPAPSDGNSANDFNFFASPQQADQGDKTEPAANNFFPELPPPILPKEPPQAAACEATIAAIAPPPIGFDQLLTQQTEQAQNTPEIGLENSNLNSFSGYFGGPGQVLPQIQQPQPFQAADSATFFDNLEVPDKGPVGQPQGDINPGGPNEDQRIQNFFNNPPLQEQPAGPGDLKYDIVHSGLGVKNLEARSQTPISNLVEPPSSACSEFSELSGTPQRQPPQQPIIQQQEVTPSTQVTSTSADLLQQHYAELPEEILKELRMAKNEKGQATPPINITYTPVVRHWFYKRSVGTKFIWTPFSHYDSALLETSLNSDDSTIIVAVEGGRYDVNIKERTKTPVYWDGKAIEVRRCSWFYKGVDSKYVPYEEATAQLLETEYKRAAETGEWHQKIILSAGEQVVFHGPTVIVHFHPQQNADTWGGSTQSTMRPRVVKRDLDDFVIEQGESQRVDHLLFMVHGIGSACDLKMRTVEEVVDDFRNIAQQLVQSHYKNSTDMGLVGRVEVLPISWHGHLHSEELGIDEKLKSITLESIPRLRNFTNDTLLDVLFYTSPTYCQKIMNTVATSLNEVYIKYRARHPEFNGGVSLAGHSLGSLILFDLLCHQEPLKESEEENMENPDQLPVKGSAYNQVQLPAHPNDMLSKQVSYAMGPAGTGQPVINYTQLIFHPKKFFALGSPIGMFVTIRGIDKLGLDFRLPTCPGFYNIFHPFDPVAYRIEALVNPDMNGIRPVLIPHHKGRKRMHLELKETMSRVGADIKQRFMDTFKTTLDSVNFLATVTKAKKEAEETLEKEISPIFQKQIEDREDSSVATTSTQARNRTDSNSTTASDPEFIELDFPLGKLNDSKRVDYVLQEAPLEFINEYIFALSSHVCYWESDDTILFVMKEIYAGLGISTDSQVPQQSMTIERPSNSVSQSLMPL
ncbi:nascent polypeptide-associated complex subunit alpha, muscle-specific form isoform X2 [Scaptodrosophila lebanonensis]|nr:nascent polypeptide-associated complex subunit alpha, muscle-specific form isoform X2 [Scaptodrosophila lebanonensis]